MNIDYLYSVINLYIRNETDRKKTTLRIKRLDNNIEFSFDMNETNSDKTSFVIPSDEYNSHLQSFIDLYKSDMMIIDEKYHDDKVKNTCYYYVLFKNGRSISFDGFSMAEMNDIRNVLYNIQINKNEIRVNNIDEEKQMAYQPRLRLQQAGFSSYVSLFIFVIIFIIVLIITLLIIKSFTN